MDRAALISGIAKLATAEQQAGLTVEQMIQLLDSGLGVEALLDLIAWRLERPTRLAPVVSSSNWVV